MCAVDYDDDKKTINLPDTDYFKEHFGSYVVINNKEDFLRRLECQLDVTGYDYIYGRVNYINMIGDYKLTDHHSMQIQSDILNHGLKEAMEMGQITDVFEKEKLLRKQKEWRLCVWRGMQEESRYEMPPLGSLRGIAELVTTEELNSLLMQQHPGFRYNMIKPSPELSYKGNISRSELQKKICKDGRYRILFNVGGVNV